MQAIQAYHSGNYEEADMAAGAAFGGMVGGDIGVAAGLVANVVLPGIGWVLVPVLGFGGSLIGSWAGAEGGKFIYKLEYPSSSSVKPQLFPILPNQRD